VLYFSDPQPVSADQPLLANITVDMGGVGSGMHLVIFILLMSDYKINVFDKKLQNMHIEK